MTEIAPTNYDKNLKFIQDLNKRIQESSSQLDGFGKRAFNADMDLNPDWTATLSKINTKNPNYSAEDIQNFQRMYDNAMSIIQSEYTSESEKNAAYARLGDIPSEVFEELHKQGTYDTIYHTKDLEDYTLTSRIIDEDGNITPVKKLQYDTVDRDSLPDFLKTAAAPINDLLTSLRTSDNLLKNTAGGILEGTVNAVSAFTNAFVGTHVGLWTSLYDGSVSSQRSNAEARLEEQAQNILDTISEDDMNMINRVTQEENNPSQYYSPEISKWLQDPENRAKVSRVKKWSNLQSEIKSFNEMLDFGFAAPSPQSPDRYVNNLIWEELDRDMAEGEILQSAWDVVVGTKRAIFSIAGSGMLDILNASATSVGELAGSAAAFGPLGGIRALAAKGLTRMLPKGVSAKLFTGIEAVTRKPLMENMAKNITSFGYTWRQTVHEAYATEDLNSNLWKDNTWANIGLFAAALADFAGDKIAARSSKLFADRYLQGLFSKNNGFLARRIIADSLASEGAVTERGIFNALKKSSIGRFFNDDALGGVAQKIIRATLDDMAGEAFAGAMEQLIQDYALHGVSVKDTAANAIISAFCIPGSQPFNMELRALGNSKLNAFLGVGGKSYTNTEMANAFHTDYLVESGPENPEFFGIDYNTYTTDVDKQKKSAQQAEELSKSYSRNKPENDAKTTAHGMIQDLRKSLETQAKLAGEENPDVSLPPTTEKAINSYVNARIALDKEFADKDIEVDPEYKRKLDLLNKKVVAQLYGNYFSNKASDIKVEDKKAVDEERKKKLNSQWNKLAHASDYESSEGISVSANEHQLSNSYADRRLQLEKTKNELQRALKNDPTNQELRAQLSDISQEINRLDAQYPDSKIKQSVRAFLKENAAELHEVNPTMNTEYSSRISGNKSLETEKDYRDFAREHKLDQVDRFSTAFQSNLIQDINYGNAESASRARRILDDLKKEYTASLDRAIQDRRKFLDEHTTRNDNGELVPKKNATWKTAVNFVSNVFGDGDLVGEEITKSQLNQIQEEIKSFKDSKAQLLANFDEISKVQVNDTEAADAINTKAEADIGLSTDEEKQELMDDAEVVNTSGGTIDVQVDNTDIDASSNADDVTEDDISVAPENPRNEKEQKTSTENTETKTENIPLPDVNDIEAEAISDAIENQDSESDTLNEEDFFKTLQDGIDAEDAAEETTEVEEEEAETETVEPTELEKKYPEIAELNNKLIEIAGEGEQIVAPKELTTEIEVAVGNLSNFDDTLLLDGLIRLAANYHNGFLDSPEITELNNAIHKFPIFRDIENLEASLTRHPLEENDIRIEAKNYYGFMHDAEYLAGYYSFLQWVAARYKNTSNPDVDLGAAYETYRSLANLGTPDSQEETEVDVITRYKNIRDEIHRFREKSYFNYEFKDTDIKSVNAGMQMLQEANARELNNYLTDTLTYVCNDLAEEFGIDFQKLRDSWIPTAFKTVQIRNYSKKASTGIIQFNEDLDYNNLKDKFSKFIQDALPKVNALGKLPDTFIEDWARDKKNGLDLPKRVGKLNPVRLTDRYKKYTSATKNHSLSENDFDTFTKNMGIQNIIKYLLDIESTTGDEFTKSEAEQDTSIRGNSPEAQQLATMQLATRSSVKGSKGEPFKGKRDSLIDMLRKDYKELLAAVRAGNARTINEAWSSITLLIVNQARKAFHGKIVGSVNQEMYQQLYQDLDTCLTFIINMHTNPKFAEVRDTMLSPSYLGLNAWMASIKTLRSTILELNALTNHFPPGMSLDEVARSISPENPLVVDVRALDGTPKGTKTYSSPDQILRLKNIVFPRSALNNTLQTAEVFTCIPLDYETSQRVYTLTTPEGKYDNTTPRKYILYVNYKYNPETNTYTPIGHVESSNTGDISFCFRSNNWVKKITQENVETTSVRNLQNREQKKALGPLYAEAHEHLQKALKDAPIVSLEESNNLAPAGVQYPEESEITAEGKIPVSFNGKTSDVNWYNAISPDCQLGTVWQFNGFTIKHPEAIARAAKSKTLNSVNRIFITSSPYLDEQKSFWDFLGLRAILRGTSPAKIEKQSLAAKSIAFTYQALINNHFIPKGFLNSDKQVSDKFSIGMECWEQVGEKEAEEFWTTTAPDSIKQLFKIWQENVLPYVIEAGTRVHRPSVSTTGMTTVYDGSITIPQPEPQVTQQGPTKKFEGQANFSNLHIHSGGALGADSIWSSIAQDMGVPQGNILHYTPTDSRPKGRSAAGAYWFRQQTEQKTGTQINVQNELPNIWAAMQGIPEFQGPIFSNKKTLQQVTKNGTDGLQIRNYLQVANSSEIFAVAPIINDKHVRGGTDTAVTMAIALGKPVHVLDISGSPQWYTYNVEQGKFVPVEAYTVAIPTNGNVALIGSRSITSYAKRGNDGEWTTTAAHRDEEKIRAMMQEAFIYGAVNAGQGTLVNIQQTEPIIDATPTPAMAPSATQPSEIPSFRGANSYLSNMYETPITYNGVTYKCVESAFQAQKDPSRATEFANLSGKEAKKKGKKVKLRSDWESVKVQIMENLLREKFKNPQLRQQLLNNNDPEITEFNDWGDTFWGTTVDGGKNVLGKLLTKIRDELRAPAQVDTTPEVKPEQMSEAAEMPKGGDDGEEAVVTPEPQPAPVEAPPVINPQREEKRNLISSLSSKHQPKYQPTPAQKQIQVADASEASPIPVTPPINPSAIGNATDTTEVQSSDESSGGVLVSHAEKYTPNVDEESLKQANATFSTIAFIRSASSTLIGRMQETQRNKGEKAAKELLRRFTAWALANVGVVPATFNDDGKADWIATTKVAENSEHFNSTLNMLTKLLAPCNLLTKKSTEAEIQEITDMCVNNLNLHSSFLELFSILRGNTNVGSFTNRLRNCLPDSQFPNKPLRQVLVEALANFRKNAFATEADANSTLDKICITGLDFLCSKYLYKGVRKGTRLNWESPIVKSLLIGITDDAEVEANLQYIRENNPPEIVNDLAAAFCVQSTFANALGDALYQALNFEQYLGNQNYTNEKKSYLKGVLGEIATVIMCDSGFLTLKTRRVKMLDEIKTVSMITGRGQEEVDIEVDAKTGKETPKQVTLDTLREFSRLATTSDVQDLYSTEARNENVVKTSPDDVHPDVSMNNHKPANDKNAEMIKETAQTPFKIPNYYVDMFSKLLNMSRGGVSLFQYLNSEFQKGNSIDFSSDGWLMKNFKTAMEVLGITAIDGLDGETKNAVQIQNEKHLNVILTVVNKHKEFQSRKKDIKDIDPNEDGLLFWTTYSMGNNSRFTLMGSDLNPQADKEFTRQFCFSTKGEKPVRLNAKHKVGTHEFSEHQVLAFGILQNLDKKPEKKIKVSNWTEEARKPIMVALRGAFATKNAGRITSKFAAYNAARKALEAAGYPFEHPVAILNTMQTMEQFLEGINNVKDLDAYIEKLENAATTEEFYEILENHLKDGAYTNYMHIESDGVTNGPAIGVTYVIGMRDYLADRFKNVPAKDSVDFLDAIGVSTNRENMYDSKDKNNPDGVVQDLYEYIKSHLPIEDMFNEPPSKKGDIANCTFKNTGIKFIDFLVANFDANADDIKKKEEEYFDTHPNASGKYVTEFYQGLIGDILTRDLIKGPATQGSYGAMLGAVTRGLLTHPIGGIFTTFKKKINSPEFKNNPKKVREAFNKFIRALVDFRGANKIYEYEDLTGRGFLEDQKPDNGSFASLFNTTSGDGYTVRSGINASLFKSMEDADKRRDEKTTWLANHPDAYINEFHLEANRAKLFHFENNTKQGRMADPILVMLMYQNSYEKLHGDTKAFDKFDELLRKDKFRVNDWFNDPEYRKEFCENHKEALADLCYELNYSIFIEEAQHIKLPGGTTKNKIKELAKEFAQKKRENGFPAKSLIVPGHALMENLTRLCISKIKAPESYEHKDTPEKVRKVFHDGNFGMDYINAMNLLFSPEGLGLLPNTVIEHTVQYKRDGKPKEFKNILSNSILTPNTTTLGEYIFTEVFNSFNKSTNSYRTQKLRKDTLKNNQEIAQIYCDIESTFHDYSWTTPTATAEDTNLKQMNEAEKANSFFIHGMPNHIAIAMTGNNINGKSYISKNGKYQKMPCPVNVRCDGISFKNDFGETNVDLVVQSGKETPNVRLAKIKGIPVLNFYAQIRQIFIDGVPTYFEVNASNEDVFAKYGSQNDKVLSVAEFLDNVANNIRSGNRQKDGSYYMDILMRMYAKDPDYFYTCMFKCAETKPNNLIGDGNGTLAKFLQENVDRTVLYTKVMSKPKQVTNDFKEGQYDNGRTFTVDKLGRLSELVTPAFKDTMGSAVFSAIMDPMGGNRAMTQMSIASLPYYARICVHLLEIANSEDYVVQPTDTPQLAELKKKYAEFIDTMVKRLMGGGLLKVGSGEFLPVMESSNENDIENKIIVQDNKNISHFNSGKIALMMAIGIKMMVQSVHSQDSGIASFTGKLTGRGYLNIHDALEGLCNAGFFKGNLQQNIAFMNACLNPGAANNPDFNYVNFFRNVDNMYSVFTKLRSLGDIIPAEITSAKDATKMFNAVMDSDLRHSLNLTKICKGFIFWDKKTKKVKISIDVKEGESQEERAAKVAKFNEMLEQLDTLAGIAHEFSGIYAGAEEKAWEDTVNEAFQGFQSFRDFNIHKDFSFNDTRGLMFYAMKRALAHLLFKGSGATYADLGMKGGHTLDDIVKDLEKSENGIADTLAQNIDPKEFLELVKTFANPYALVNSKYEENIDGVETASSYAVSLALRKVQLPEKQDDKNYLWKVLNDPNRYPKLVQVLHSPEVRDGVLEIFRELLQGCAEAHDKAAEELVSNNPNIFQYNVGFAENAEYLKKQNRIDREEAEKTILSVKRKKLKASEAYKLAFNSQTKYAKEFYDLAGDTDLVLNCKDPGTKLSAFLRTSDGDWLTPDDTEITNLLAETLNNLENASDEDQRKIARQLVDMQGEFSRLSDELIDTAVSLLNDPSVSKINMYNTMDDIFGRGVWLNTSKGELLISAPVLLHTIRGKALVENLTTWAKTETKSALQAIYNAAEDVFNAYNTLYVANGIRTREGDNFTQGIIKGNQADAVAQADQALRDAFNAIRNGQPLPNNMVREIEIATEKQLLDTYDNLSANVSMSNNTEMVGMSADHDKTLRGRLQKLAGLFSGIKVLLGNKGTAGVAFTGGNTVAIQQGVADAMKAGIPMSTKEMFGHENCHIAFKAVDRNSKEFAQLKQAWRQAREYLATRKHLLMVHHWTAEELGSQELANQANQVEMRKAEARYDYMFGTGEAGSTANDLVEEFAVLAYTNEFVEKALKDVPFVASQGKSETSALGKLIDAIIEFVDGVFKKLTEKIKKNKIKVTPTLMTAVENVFDSLVETESRYDRIVKSEAMTRLSTKITQASNKIGEIEDVAREHISGWMSPNKKELVSRVVQTIREQGRLTRELINETLGTNFKDPSGRSIIASFINKITVLNKTRQQNKALDAKFLTESFGNTLTKEEAKAIRDGVCILDLQCLKNIYSNDAIMELLTGSDEPVTQAVNHHKQMVRDSILAANLPEEFVNFVINCGNNLACKLATDSWSMALTHQNAAQILNAYGTDFAGVANGVPQDQALRLHQILDEYISLKAMQLYRQHADNADNMALLRELWRVEKASSQTARRSHGFNAVLNYHQATVQTSREYIAANTIDKEAGGLHTLVNVRKGYLKPQFSPYYETVAVTTEEERTDLIHRGYSTYDGPEATLPNTISGMTIMYNTYPISTKHTSGALTTISNHAVGTNMEKEEEVRRYVGHNIGRIFGNLLIGELPITPNKEISIELGYTDEGNVKALRFVDSRAMREKLLEEDTNFANALAATSANICEKTISAEANRELIDTLLEIEATEYNPAQESEWVIMSPDSENETVVQDYGNMPEDTRRYLFQRLQERGWDYLRVKKNHYNMVFGYHNASLRNLTDPSAEEDQTNKNIEERARTVFQQVAYNLLATKFGMAGQAVLEYLVHLAKDMVVNKSFIVSYKNMKSNIQLLSMAGVNPKDALALTLQGYKHFTAYNTQIKKRRKLRDEITYGDLPEATRKTKLSELRMTIQELADNPIGEYMSLGGSTSIVAGEYDVNQDSEFTPLRGVMKIFDENAGTAGKRIKPILNWLLIRHGSTPYDIAQELATGTDTVAKWIYYEYLKKNEFTEDTDEARTNAFMKAQETFISFDLPTNKWVQLGNDLGFLWFTKYLFRTQRVIATQFREKPARTLCYLFLWKAMHLPWLDGSILPSTVFNLSSVTQKISNPITRTLSSTSMLPAMRLLNAI